MNICRQRLIKVDRLLRQRSLANENAVVCRQGAMCWRVWSLDTKESHWEMHFGSFGILFFDQIWLRQKYHPPQVWLDLGSNSCPLNDESTFPVTETPAVSTRPSMTFSFQHCWSSGEVWLYISFPNNYPYILTLPPTIIGIIVVKW